MIWFFLDINKSVEEDMRKVLRRRIAAVHFDECNNMAFHDLSRNKVVIVAHNLTSLLGLVPKLFPQFNQVSFRNS